jgi:hypothetical protein
LIANGSASPTSSGSLSLEKTSFEPVDESIPATLFKAIFSMEQEPRKEGRPREMPAHGLNLGHLLIPGPRLSSSPRRSRNAGLQSSSTKIVRKTGRVKSRDRRGSGRGRGGAVSTGPFAARLKKKYTGMPTSAVAMAMEDSTGRSRKARARMVTPTRM